METPKKSMYSSSSPHIYKNYSARNRVLKFVTSTKTFIDNNQFQCIYHGENVTPQNLPPIDGDKSKRSASLERFQSKSISEHDMNLFGSISANLLQSNMMKISQFPDIGSSRASLAFITRETTETVMDEDLTNFESEESETEFFNLPPIDRPFRLSIVLRETFVINLLEIVSTTTVLGTDEVEFVKEDNEKFFLYEKTKLIKRTQEAECQTRTKFTKDKYTCTEKIYKKHHDTFAITWDIFDSYAETDHDDETQENASKSKNILTVNEQLEILGQCPRFQLAVLFMERALAHSIFQKKQKMYRGILFQDPFRPNIKFRYGLQLLWTFKSIRTIGHPITCMQWHPVNPDILACGYGKFFFNDKKPGIIFCWNIKNPNVPEREYSFEVPVTSLCFSKYDPHLLAVGLYNGSVAILNIAEKKVEMVMMTDPLEATTFDPIWDVHWSVPGNLSIKENHLISACEDGSINTYISHDTDELYGLDMIKIYATEKKLKGVYFPKNCNGCYNPIGRYTSALKIQRHPVKSTFYFIATGEGTIHQCSEDYLPVKVFMAHIGPVYNIQFSHYCTKLFLTCGSDSCIRLWIEEIEEPLVTLSIPANPIDGAEWCPSNSTIIASICDKSIYFWDLQRKTHAPAAKHRNPNGCRNTVLKFSPLGTCLAVGDIEGNVYIYHLRNFPFAPFYQAQMLKEVMYRNMKIKPKLAAKVREFGLVYNSDLELIF